MKKELNIKDNFIGWVSREAPIKPFTKGKTINDPYPLILTTELPAIVVDWERWEIVREVLLMSGMEFPESKQVPLLDQHSRFSLSNLLGSIRNLRIEGTAVVGDAYFWTPDEKNGVKGAVEVWSKVDQGHLTDLSAGYRTYKESTIEVPQGKEIVYDGKIFKNDYSDGIPFLVRIRTTVKEGSAVIIGADTVAKFRSELQPIIETKTEEPDLKLKLEAALEENEQLKNDNNQLIKLKPQEKKMDENTKTPEQIQKDERDRLEGLEGIKNSVIGKNYKPGEKALAEKFSEAKQSNWSVDQFRAHVFELYDDTKPADAPATELGMSDKEIDRFSLRKYVLASYDLSRGDNNAFKKNGAEYELEVLNAATQKAVKETDVKPQGRIIPYDVIAKKMLGGGLGKRAMTVGTVGDGGYLKGTDHLGSEFISLLRNRTVAGSLGVRILSGLKGSIDVPKQLTAGAFAWGAEAFAVTDTNMTFGQVTGAPKEGKASQTYTRKLLLQSDPSIDMILNEDMVNLARIGVDLAVFHGAGTNAPTGVAITSGIGDFVGASLDWDAILEAEEDIAVANADLATLKWALSPSSRRIVKGRLKSSNVSGYLMEPDGKINGYGSEVSNQISNGYMMFGDWSKVWLMDWNMFDILVNPYKDNTGNVTVVIFVYADVAVSIASALTMADDVS